MRHDEFQIGSEFVCGNWRWRCTDLGARVIVAIRLDHEDDPTWYKGPPYAVAESVFDEYDQEGCNQVDARVADVRFANANLVVEFMDGLTITIPLTRYPRLLGATTEQRAIWHRAGSGDGVHWPAIDEDLSVEGLLRDATAEGGSMASEKPVQVTRGGKE